MRHRKKQQTTSHILSALFKGSPRHLFTDLRTRFFSELAGAKIWCKRPLLCHSRGLRVPHGQARVERSAQAAELWFHKRGGDFWNGKPERVQEFSGTMPGGARPSRVEPRRSVNNGAALRRAA